MDIEIKPADRTSERPQKDSAQARQYLKAAITGSHDLGMEVEERQASEFLKTISDEHIIDL